MRWLKDIRQNIKQLESKVNRLEQDVWELENPKVFKYGDKVAAYMGKIVFKGIFKGYDKSPKDVRERYCLIDTGNTLMSFYERDLILDKDENNTIIK